MQLPYFVPGVSDDGSLRDLVTLERLTADLRAYASGRGPTEAEIAAAPVIDAWYPVLDLSSCRFAGSASGHPRVGPGPTATSRVYAVDRSHRWARTYSRLWRLGYAASALQDGPRN